MSTRGVIDAGGLQTTGNDLGFPPGSYSRADNCCVYRNALWPRRGQDFDDYVDGDPTDANDARARELYQWGAHLLVSYFESQTDVWGLSLFRDWISGTDRVGLGAFAPPNPTRLRMKFAQLAKSLFWTTDLSLGTLDVATGGTTRLAGIPAPAGAYIVTASTGGTRLAGNPDATGNWLAKDRAVAGRAVFGFVDANNRVVLSKACGRTVVVNPADVTAVVGALVRTGGNLVTATFPSHGFRVGDVVLMSTAGEANFPAGNKTVTGVTATTFTYSEAGANAASAAIQVFTSGTKTVQWVFQLPPGFTFSTKYFVQLYRTDESATAAIDPGDECFLGYERFLTLADIAAGFVTIQDTTPSSRLGDPLDSNKVSGDGELLGANERPPICDDICVWDGCMWGANTVDRHRLTARLLGIGSPAGLQSGDVFIIGTRALRAGTDFTLVSQYGATRNVLETLQFFAIVANTIYSQGLTMRVAMSSDADETFGRFVFEENTIGGAQFFAATNRQSAFAEALPLAIDVTEGSTSRTSNVVTVTAPSHALETGDYVILAIGAAGNVNFPAGKKGPITVTGANTFTYAETGSNATMTGDYWVAKASFGSEDFSQPLRSSKPGEPEAWPLGRVPSGLPDGADVLRVRPSASGSLLMIFLKDGDIYQLSGQFPYVVDRFDGTATLMAADTLQEHAGALHAVTTQGVVAITEAGVRIVGGDVEDDIRRYLSSIQTNELDGSSAFGVSYESDRQYHAWMPDELNNVASNGYIFNSLEQKWTRWPIRRRCGLVFKGADLLVMGDAFTNKLRIERKAYGTGVDETANFSDEAVSLLVQAGGAETVQMLAADPGVHVGDVLEVDGAFFHVLAVDGTLLTLDGTTSDAGSVTATVYFSIPVDITFVPDARGHAGIESAFRELQLHFGRLSTPRFDVTYRNETDAAPAAVPYLDSQYSIGVVREKVTTARVPVSEEAIRCAALSISISMRQARGLFKLLGYSLTGEETSEKTGR